MRTINLSTYELLDLERIVKKYIKYKERHRNDKIGTEKWNDTDYEIERANILLDRIAGKCPSDMMMNSISYTHDPIKKVDRKWGEENEENENDN